ncbi:trypsin-like serine peptidase (plasmid) [Rhizobium leguminosarum]
MLAKDIVPKGDALCNSSDHRPLSVWRELYFGRQRTMRCTDAVKKVQDFESKSGKEIFKDIASSPEAGELSDTYEAECLVKFSAVTDPNGGYSGIRAHSNHLTYMSSPDEIERIRKSVGTLSRLNGRNYCSASLVNIATDRTGLLTAMHCIGQEMEIQESSSHKLTYTFGEVTFRSISGGSLRLALDTDLTNIVYDPFYGDIVIVEVKTDAPGRYLPIADFAPDLWEPLVLMGVSPFLNARAAALGQKPQQDLAELITVSLEPYCTVMSRDVGGRLYYGCQTEQSQSGGPIMVLRNQKFYVAGVHTRGAADKPYSCSDDAALTPNSGISIIAQKTPGGKYGSR